MTWTYTDPSTSDKDAVRFLVGDTDTTEQLLTDEEITYLLAQTSSVDDAAYNACMAIVAKFSRLMDKAIGKVKITYSQRVKQYNELADKLWLNAGIVVTPYAGGISVTDKENMKADNSLVQPAFGKGMMDNKRYI